MTTLTYPTATIMAYDPDNAIITGIDSNVALPYWAGAFVYFPRQTAVAATAGIRKHNIDPDGASVLVVSAATLGIDGVAASSGGGCALSWDGTRLCFISHASNCSELALLNTTALTLVTQFGTASSCSGTTESDSTTILTPHNMVGLNHGVGVFLTTHDGFRTAGEICSLTQAGLTNTRLGETDEAGFFNTFISSHHETAGFSYAVATPYRPGTFSMGVNDQPLGVYKVTSSALIKLGTFSPADVDATWTNIVNVAGTLLDEVDGHIIIGVGTNDAVANQNYLVKLSSTTGAVIWAIAVTSTPSEYWGMTHSRCRGSVYHYRDGFNTIRHIATDTGTVTSSETISGMNNTTGPVYSDDVTNSIIWYGSYTAPVSPPDFVGAYMGDGGHHDTVNHWHRYWFATAPTPPPPTITELGITFADFRDTSFLDWNDDDAGVTFNSYLSTFYMSGDDDMFWMYSPYLYTFFYTDQTTLITDSSCLMSAKWDWTDITDVTAPKETAYQQVYRAINGKIVSVTKKKIRGKGRTLLIKFKSQTGKDFHLLGWGLVVSKNVKP